MTNLESLVENNIDKELSEVYSKLCEPAFRQQLTELHSKYGGVMFDEDWKRPGRLDVKKDAPCMIEVSLCFYMNVRPARMLVLEKYDNNRRPVLSVKQFKRWKEIDIFKSRPVYNRHPVVEENGRFYAEKSILGFKKRVEIEKFIGYGSLMQEALVERLDFALELLVDRSKGKVEKQELRTCGTYGIPCIYKLSEMAPMPCFGSQAQCNQWREKYAREMGK